MTDIGSTMTSPTVDTKKEESENSIRALCIGDVHFMVNQIEETNLMCEEIYRVTQEVKPDFIVVLGDVLDTHERVNLDPLERATEFLSKLSKMSQALYLTVGNHDRPNNSTFLTSQHAFTGLKKWPNTYVADKPLRMTIGNQDFIFVPYVPPGRFKEALDTLENKDLSTVSGIFAHQEFKGCSMGAIKSTQGDVLDEKLPHVVSGHIHVYERLQSNITYVGTPRQITFGDKTKKSVSEYIYSKDKDGGVEVKEVRHYLKCKQKSIVHLDVKQAETYDPPKDAIIKLIVSGTAAELHVFKKHSAERLSGVKLQYKVIEKAKEPDNVRVNSFHTTTRRTFAELLYSAIQSDTSLKEAYENL